MLKLFYIMLLTFIGAMTLYLMYGEIPAPTTKIEKVLPNEYFFDKKRDARGSSFRY